MDFGHLRLDLWSRPRSSLYDGLVHYWNLNEESGSRADSVAGGFALAETGSVGYYSGGINSNSAQYPGTAGNYLSHANDASLHIGTGFTLGFWVSGPTATAALVKGDAGELDWEYSIYFDKPVAVWTPHFMVVGGTGDTTGDTIDLAAPDSYSTGWHLVFCTYDPSDRKAHIRVYEPGEAYQEATSSALASAHHEGTSAFTLGGYDGSGGFQGYLDEFMIWNRIIVSTEMDAAWNEAAGKFYPFT